MKHIVCSVSDRAVGSFMRPFFAPSRGWAQRSFADEVKREGSEMHSHPEDYELHYLGEWDDVTARFINAPEIEVIVRAKDLVPLKGNGAVHESSDGTYVDRTKGVMRHVS